MKLSRRLLILGGVLAAAFSSVFLLPEVPPIKESRLAMELPMEFGDWEGRAVAIGERELQILANDTSFERKSFTNWFDPSAPPVEVSIVFSGKDLNNSIHRPEVCLRTQGWNFVSERFIDVPSAIGGEPLPVKEIICSRTRKDRDGKAIVGPEGKPVEDWQILYYTFIGHKNITPGHYQRTFTDIRDRIVGGYDQRWAYATFSTIVTGKYSEQGMDLGILRAMDLDQSGKYLGAFIRELLPRVLENPAGET